MKKSLVCLILVFAMVLSLALPVGAVGDGGPEQGTGLAIVTQPVNYVGQTGDAVSFSVEAVGDGLSYQWQYSSDAGRTWGNSGLPGNRTATLSTEFTEARLAYWFRCVVTDAAGSSVTSDAVRMIRAAALAITAQPEDYAGQLGDAVSFTVAASGSGLSYQWQYSGDGGVNWGPSGLPGNKTATLSTELTQARLAYRFRCVVTDSNGGSVTSNAVRMVISEPAAELAITSQPVDYVGQLGDAVSFTVEASGSGLGYQWQYSNDGGATWKPSGLPGNRTATLSTELTEARLAYRFRCVVTDSDGGSVTSDAVRMLKRPSGIEIVSQPVNYEGQLGDAVSFTVEATGSELSYQWQYVKDDGIIWYNSGLPGNATATLTTELTEARLRYTFRCVITDGSGNTAVSDSVHMIIREPEVEFAITSQPSDFVGSIGDAVSFTVGATGAGLSYQWQYSNDRGVTWKASGLPGNKTATLTTEFTEARLIYLFRCVVTDAYGSSLTSDQVRMTEAAVLEITGQPEDYEGNIGDTVSFTVEATGAGLTYQWQYSNDGGVTWKASGLPGNKTATLTTEFTEARLIYLFRCVVTDGSGNSAATNAVRMTEAMLLRITGQPVNYVGSIGDAVSFTVEASGTGLTYQWQYSGDLGATWANSGLPGNRTATLSTELTEARLRYIFRCVVTDSRGNSEISDAVRMVERNGYVITLHGGEYEFDFDCDEFDENVVFDEAANNIIITCEPGGECWLWDYFLLRDGYWFYTWQCGGEEMGYVSDISSDMDFYPVFVRVYDVTCDANGGFFWNEDTGEADLSQATVQIPEGIFRVNMGEQLPLPEREGYSFIGWTFNGKLVSRIDLTSDVTLTALWEKAHTVTYDANGGGWRYNEDTGEYDDTYYDYYAEPGFWQVDGRVSDPEREGFIFLGWSYNGKLVKRVNVSDDITFTAMWTAAATVRYHANGGYWTRMYDIVSTDDGEIATFSVAPGPYYPYMIEDPICDDGRLFDCWELDERFVRDRIDLAAGEEYDLVARWYTPVSVTYNANGGGWGDSYYNENSEEYFYTEVIRTDERSEGDEYTARCEHPYREGYTFMGWGFEPDDPEPFEELWFEWLTCDYTFYAVWQPNPAVTYDCGDGWLWYDEDGEPVCGETVYAAYGEDFDVGGWWVEIDGPYRFIGWSLDPDAEEAGTDWVIENLTEDVTLYAIFEELACVTYDANGGGWGYDDDLETYYDTLRLDWREDGRYYYVGFESPWREGYDFRGWYTAAVGGERADGDELVLSVGGDYTYYAHWAKLITVEYDANGGSYDDEGAELSFTREYRDDEELWLDGMHPQRPGYEFLGWSREQSDDWDVEIMNGQFQFTSDEAEAAEATFYAVWAKRLTVFYDNGGIGGWGWYDDQTGEFDQTDFVRDARADNFIIDGWWPGSDGPWDFVGYLADYTEQPGEDGEIADEVTDDFFYPNQECSLPNDSVFIQTGYDENGEIYYFVTLTAQWNKLPTITYDANGGGWGEYYDDEIDGYNYDETVREHWDQVGRHYYVGMEPPQREGYEFRGWIDSDDEQADERELVLEDGDEYVFTALWSMHVTVAYDANGGSFDGYDEWNGETDFIHYRDTFLGDYRLDGWEPRLEGYEFLGWSLDPDAEAADFDHESVIELTDEMVDEYAMITLYAVWEPMENAIFYYGNGGEWGLVDQSGNYQYFGDSVVHAIENEESYIIGVMGPLHREGYEFIGWSEDEDAEEADYGNFETMLYETELDLPAALYAVWAPLPGLTLDADGGLFWDDLDSITLYFDSGTAVRPDDYPCPYREGYTFAGWADEDGDILCRLTLTGDTTLYAAWDRRIEVIYDANGGVFEDDIPELTDEAGLGWYWVGEVFWREDLPEPSRLGYEFGGWIDDEGDYIDRVKLSSADDGITFRAGWDYVGYNTVTLNANGGFFDGDESDTERTFVLNTGTYMDNYVIGDFTVTNLAQPNGMAPAGWYTNADLTGEPIDLNYYRVDGDATLYLKWVPASNVVLHANGGHFTWYDGQALDYMRLFGPIGSEFYLYEYTSRLSRGGSSLLGWYYEPECENLATESFVFTGSEAQIDLWAGWSDEETVTVTFDPNGGFITSRYDYDDISFEIPVGENIGFEVRVDSGGYENLVFDHWNTAPDGSGDNVDLYRFTPRGDTVLYAIWTRYVDLTYHANGGLFYDDTDTLVSKVTANSGEYEPINWEINKDGYVFAGWSTDANVARPVWSVWVGSEDIDLYAVWEECQPEPIEVFG